MSQMSVIWDLDDNSEIYTLHRPREFCTIETFIRTGFIYDLGYKCVNQQQISQDERAYL